MHFHQREEGTVKAGTLGAQIGREKIVVPTGGPAGVVHKWWNAGDDLLEFNGQATPTGDLDRYLQAAFAVLNAGPSGRPSIFLPGSCCGGTGTRRRSWRHRELFSGHRSRWFCGLAVFLANTEEAGLVRPSRALVRRRSRGKHKLESRRTVTESNPWSAGKNRLHPNTCRRF